MFGGPPKNVFGENTFGQQAPPGLFGSGGPNTKTTSSGLFGMPPIPEVGKQPAVSESAFLFGSSPSSANTNSSSVLFGKPMNTSTNEMPNQPSTNASSTILFGKPTETPAQNQLSGFGNASSQMIFGKPSLGSSGSTNELFGNVPTAMSNTPATQFSSFVKQAPAENTANDQPVLFAKPANTFSSTSLLFGKPAVSKTDADPSEAPATATTQQLLFGKPAPSSNMSTSLLFGKPSSGAPSSTFTSTANQNLFGKSHPVGQKMGQEEPAKGQFHNQPSETSFKVPFPIASSGDSQPAKSGGDGFANHSSTVVKADTPDLFKNVVATSTSNQFQFGSVFSKPPPPMSKEKASSSLFGEPAAKKSWKPSYNTSSNLFAGVTESKPEKSIFPQVNKQTGGPGQVIPLFGKPVFSSATKIDTSVPPPPVFRTGTQLGKRPFDAPMIQGRTLQEVGSKRKLPTLGRKVDKDQDTLLDEDQKLFPDDEIRQSFSIVCKQVPKQALISKKILEKHFSRFGKVIKVSCHPSKEMATVHFDSHEAARNAKENGLTITPKLPNIGSIFFGKTNRKPSGSSLVDEPMKTDDLKTVAQVQLKPSVDVKELTNLIRMQAQNDGDRYTILDARDKLIRFHGAAKKSQNVSIGTCPDICPEKERYSRSDKNQLRLYEKLDGKVHHSAVVKEYSRSSADQDVPLPHELRPPSILSRTMTHILCNIVDRIENMEGSMANWYAQVQGKITTYLGYEQTNENVGDWFEYVWSTTRAIRKDITQQDLNDPLTVELVEKCARFHIVCAERLIEEDPSKFDRKLNDENLTKCIQTLKHMYEDLRHHNIQCPNEPEFRAYDVILKLNDGDTLISVESLPQWVRNSQEMTFALKVYSALNTNNYVRFFKMVKQSTLLQGCLLLRYFDQVRSRAIVTIIKSYCPVSKPTIFSLSKLSFILGFEDNFACAEFFQLHGIFSDCSMDSTSLDRGNFQPMDTVPEPRRPKSLVESKRLGQPWSVIINGGPLPENPYLTYKPHDSFDANGFLKPESRDASDQVAPQSESTFQYKVVELIRDQVPSIDESQELLDTSIEVLEEIVESECTEVVSEIIQEAERDKAAEEIAEDLLDEETESLLQLVGADAIKDCKNEELARRLKEEAQLAAIEEVVDDLNDDVIAELVLEISGDEMKSVARQIRLNELFESADEIVGELFAEVVAKDVVLVCRDAIDELFIEREEKIVELQERQRLRKIGSVFKRWQKTARKQRQRRDTWTNFASMPGGFNLESQLQRLGKTHQENLHAHSFRSRLREIDRLYKSVTLEDNMLTTAILEKIDLKEAIAKLRPEENHFVLKLIVCLPDLSLESPHRPFGEMIKKKLKLQGEIPDENDPSVLACATATSVDGRKVEICVRYVTNETLTEEISINEKLRRHCLMGTSGILFLQFDDEVDDIGWRSRLELLIDNIPKQPPVPIQILTTSTASEKGFDFDWLKSKSNVGATNISYTNSNIFDITSVAAAHKSVNWLIQESPATTKPKGLVFKTLTDYVEDFLGSVYLTEVNTNLEERLRQNLPHLDPNVLIELYNCAIDQLVRTCQRESLMDISWPCPELHGTIVRKSTRETIPSYWNDPAYLDTIVASLRQLRLPTMNEKILSLTSGGEIKSFIVDYFNSFRKSFVDPTFCQSQIERSLSKAKFRPKTETQFAVPWTFIIDACIEYKLKCLDTQDQFSKRQAEMKVVYFEDHLGHFERPKLWTSALGLTTLHDASVYKKRTSEKFESFASISQRPTNLQVQLEEERSKSEAFEETLRKVLSEVNNTFVGDSEKLQQVEAISPVRGATESFYIPVVSWLSPSLAIRSTPKSVKQRVTFYTTEKSNRKRQSLPDKLTISDGSQLQMKMKEELDQSLDFEARLHAALGQK